MFLEVLAEGFEFDLEVGIGEGTRVLEVAQTGIGEGMKITIGDEGTQRFLTSISDIVHIRMKPCKDIGWSIVKLVPIEVVDFKWLDLPLCINIGRSFAIECIRH